MKALVISGVNDYGLKSIPTPEISSQEVLVEMKASGICHSDYELISGQYIIPFEYPIIPGHEWVGELVKVGNEVKGFKVGDRVTGECAIGCEICSVCQSGQFTYCPSADHFGFTIDGSNAEYFKAKPEWLHKIPDGVDYLSASLIEPFSVGYNGIHGAGGVDASDFVVVQGGGPIGLCTAAAAKAMGAKVALLEPLKYRREIANTLGVDYAIDPITGDAEEAIKQLTKGYGADLVVEASGHSAALKQSLDLVKNSGMVSYIGINIGNEIPVELGKIQIKGITAKGMVGSPYVWDKVINFLIESQLDLSPIITHRFPLGEAEDAFKFANNPDNKAIKVTITNY